MLPPLPKKALKIAPATTKRIVADRLKKKAMSSTGSSVVREPSLALAPGFLRRGKPYLTVRDRSVASAS
jgi:hypothetical protein